MAKQNRRGRAKPPERRNRKKRSGRLSASTKPIEKSSQLLSSALELQQAGQRKEAASLYRQILKAEPKNADAWHLLGMTMFANEQIPAAIETIQRAIELSPRADFYANLGVVLRANRQLDQARKHLKQAVELNPQFANAWNNLGTVYLELGQLEQAEKAFAQALSLNPDFAQANMNLGNLWQQQGRFKDAERVYRQQLAKNPNNILLLNNLGESLRNQSRLQEAIDCMGLAAQLDPTAVEPRLNLARCHALAGQTFLAQQTYTNLIEQYPELAKPYHYLGRLQHELGDFENALKLITRSLELDPADPFSQSSLGFVHLEMGNKRDAEQCFQRVLAFAPQMHDAHSCLLFLMSGKSEIDPQKLFDEHRRWGEAHGDVTPLISKSSREARITDSGRRRLRIGYVSPDFRKHAVAAFIEPVLAAHDRQRVETFCYAEVSVPDEMTRRLQQSVDHWHFTTGLSDEQVARQIVTDEIDILIDLAGHTGNNRLRVFAYRPAPVQVTWLGYPNTTGLSTIDYRLTCSIQNPEGEPSYHSEKLVRMPHCSFCFSEPKDAPSISELPAVKNGFLTFGSLHRPEKISKATIRLWSAVLTKIPTSKIFLFNTRFNPSSISKLTASMVDQNIEPDRINICNSLPHQHYLEAYRNIDIALDVTPWAGGTTTLEALWMGAPVVAFYGDRRSARSTATIVDSVGHPEWIADDINQFENIANDLTSDLNHLKNLRMQLREQVKSTIVDNVRFTKSLEDTFFKLWAEG